MNFKNIIFFLICFILLTTGITYSQQDSTIKKTVIKKDTVEIGMYYSFYLSNSQIILGKVMGIDKNTLLVYVEGNLKTIDKKEIITIENARAKLYNFSVIHKKTSQDRVYWFFGGGYLITIKENANQYTSLNRFNNGLNMHVHSLVTFGDYFGLRADFDYNHIPKGENTEYYSGQYSQPGYSTYSGGTINSFHLRFNLSPGYFKPDKIINAYFILGLGIGGYFREDETSTSVYSGREPYTYNFSHPMEFTLGLSLGAGLNIKLSDKIRCFTEYQYNNWSGNYPNYYTLKAGIMLTGK